MAMDSGSIFESDLSDLEIPGFDDAGGTSIDGEEKIAAEAEPEAEAEAEVAEVEAEAETEAEDKPEEKPAPKTGEKVLKFKAGDKEVPLAETAVVSVKIDGKAELVPVKELLTNYSGKVAYDRKFTELSKQRDEVLAEAAKVERERTRHVGIISSMHKNVMEGKMFDAITNLLEMSGLDKKLDARAYTKTLREAMGAQVKQLEALSPEARQLRDAEEETGYLKSKSEREAKLREQEQADKAFQARVAKSVNDSGATFQEFVKSRDWLITELKKRKEDVSQVTPEYVANHLKEVRDFETAQKALQAVNPELVKDQELWDDTVKILRMNPEWTVKDLEEVIRAATKTKRAQAVSKTVRQAPVATASTPAAKKKPIDPRLDFSNFTEADFFR